MNERGGGELKMEKCGGKVRRQMWDGATGGRWPAMFTLLTDPAKKKREKGREPKVVPAGGRLRCTCD